MTPTTTIRATMSKKNCKDCAFSLGDIQKVRLSLRGEGDLQKANKNGLHFVRSLEKNMPS